MRLLKSVCLVVVLLCSQSQAADVALIIDDMGNRSRDALAFSLPKEIAFSILPHKPLSTLYSKRAADQQREVMLHIPMESLAGKKLGPGSITADMHPLVIHQVLQDALATVPHAIGMNNHMGSKLTQLTLPMSSTMEFLQQHDMFFVDSRTTRFSKAEQIARQKGVLSTRRNVFLDHYDDVRQIDVQFRRLVRLAKKYGFAVGIAHPYPQSVEYLQQQLPTLAEHGIRLVPLSDVLRMQELARLNKVEPSEQQLDE